MAAEQYLLPSVGRHFDIVDKQRWHLIASLLTAVRQIRRLFPFLSSVSVDPATELAAPGLIVTTNATNNQHIATLRRPDG